MTRLINGTLACDSRLAGRNLTGQIVIIPKGNDGGDECGEDGLKARCLHEAGAADVLIHNSNSNETEAAATSIQSYQLHIPVACLNYRDGSALINLLDENASLASSPVMIQFTAKMVRVNPQGNRPCE